MKLDVPYYSQFIDVNDPFWMLRACGATSLKMVAEYHKKEVPDILTLCHEAKERGGYHLENGWIHDYLVEKAQEFGLSAYRKEGLTDLSEIIQHLDRGYPVIVSVEKRVLEQRRFHIIVFTGYEKKNDQETGDETNDESEIATSYRLQPKGRFYYHEPESTNKEKGQHRVCGEDVFMEYWRGKAIFITPSL